MLLALRPVTKDNFEAVIELPLHAHQEGYLASNVFSIAEAGLNPHFRARAVYAADELIGFMLYAPLAEEGQPGEYSIFRFMIDCRHQGKGHGRRALELALDEMRAEPGAHAIWICYWPNNPAAKRFYASVGFVEDAIDDNGEMWAVLRFGLPPVVA